MAASGLSGGGAGSAGGGWIRCSTGSSGWTEDRSVLRHSLVPTDQNRAPRLQIHRLEGECWRIKALIFDGQNSRSEEEEEEEGSSRIPAGFTSGSEVSVRPQGAAGDESETDEDEIVRD